MARDGMIDATAPAAEAAIAQAIDWHLRRDALDDRGWGDFVAWLDVPAHAAAYDRVALADAALAEAGRPATPAPLPTPANDDAPLVAGRGPRHRGWRAGGWGIAGLGIAAALALVVMPTMRSPDPTRWIETRAGENRSVALADGTRIEINGATRLGIAGGGRLAMLDRGQAVFHVAHDAQHPFQVRSGAVVLEDVGTVFDVARDEAQVDVAVAEGGVMVEPAGERVALAAGQAASIDEARHRIERRAIAPDMVGGWRGGRLAFADTPLSQVTAAIRRRYGVDVALQSGLSDRPFTGMVAMSGSATRDVPHLAALIGAEWRQQGERWILTPAGSPR